VAWLHTTPTKANAPRKDTVTNPELPNVYDGIELIHIFFKFREVTYTEIAHSPFADKLTDWDKETLVMLGGRYDAMRQKAIKPGFPPPYQSLKAEKIEDRINHQWDQLWSMAGG